MRWTNKHPYMVLIVAVLVPGLVGFAWHRYVSRPNEQSNEMRSRDDGLVAVKSNVDIGRAKHDAVVRTAFELRNISDDEIHLVAMKPGCGCTQVENGPSSLKPGATMQLISRIDLAQISETNFQKPIIVDYRKGTQTGQLVLYISGSIDSRPQLALVPGIIDVGEHFGERPLTAEVFVVGPAHLLAQLPSIVEIEVPGNGKELILSSTVGATQRIAIKVIGLRLKPMFVSDGRNRYSTTLKLSYGTGATSTTQHFQIEGSWSPHRPFWNSNVLLSQHATCVNVPLSQPKSNVRIKSVRLPKDAPYSIDTVAADSGEIQSLQVKAHTLPASHSLYVNEIVMEENAREFVGSFRVVVLSQ